MEQWQKDLMKAEDERINGINKAWETGDFNADPDNIQKGKKANIGEVRTWQGKKYKKVQDGKWVEVSEHGMTKKQHENAASVRKTDMDLGRDPYTNKKKFEEHLNVASKLSGKEHTDEEVGLGKNDFKEGKILKFKNGEEWIVVKDSKVSSKDNPATRDDEVMIKPHNSLAKERNISLPNTVSLDYLNKELAENSSDPHTKQFSSILDSGDQNKLDAFYDAVAAVAGEPDDDGESESALLDRLSKLSESDQKKILNAVKSEKSELTHKVGDKIEYKGVTIHVGKDKSGGQDTTTYKAPSISDKTFWDLDALKKQINKSQDDNLEKAEQTEAQRAKVKKVMEEFKNGTLKSSSGDKVTDREQALAIALSEAGLNKSQDADLKKGKGAVIGEVRTWNGKRFKKVQDGKWVEVSEHGMSKKEHEFKESSHRTMKEKVQHWGKAHEENEEKKHQEAASKLSDKEHTDEEVGLGEKKEDNQFDHTFFDDYKLSGDERKLILDVKYGRKPINELVNLHDNSSNIDEKGREYLRKFMNKSQEDDIQKARAGVYTNTPENKKKGRVGLKYGNKKEGEEKGGEKQTKVKISGYKNLKTKTYATDTSPIDFEVNINGKSAKGFWNKTGQYTVSGVDINELEVYNPKNPRYPDRIQIFKDGGGHRSYEISCGSPAIELEKQPKNLHFTGEYYRVSPELGKIFSKKIMDAINGNSKANLTDEFKKYFGID